MAVRPPNGTAAASRQWVAPDDNPDFLKSLKDENEKDETVLKDWEADLRRREDELKRREGGPESTPPAS